MCTILPPNFGHVHRLLQHRVTLTSLSLVAPPTAEPKAEERLRINEMKEQAKRRKVAVAEDAERQPEVKRQKVAGRRVSMRTMDERAKDRAAKKAANDYGHGKGSYKSCY